MKKESFIKQNQTDRPVSEEDWFHLSIQAKSLFTPHTPIDEQALFSGRTENISKLIEVVFQRGQHALVFGERGVGKSSLANIIKDKIFSRVTSVLSRIELYYV